MRAACERAHRSGFTVVECAVVALVLAVLIALALPMLRRVRQSGIDAASLANLRTHGSNVLAYASENDDYFPYFTSPQGPVEFDFQGETYVMDYFAAHYRWQIVLADDYYGGVAPHRSQIRPRDTRICSYYYSASLLADPYFWDPKTRTGPVQWRATRVSEVAFPSRKGVFVDVGLGVPFLATPPHREVSLSAADGSCSTLTIRQLTEPHFTGEGDFEGSIFKIGIYVMHTQRGVAGWDIAR